MCSLSMYNVAHCFSSLSSSMSKDRVMPREPNPTKKDAEFRSIFQHVQTAQLRRSPSELFAQHIVSIVHYIKGKVWPVLALSRLHRLRTTGSRVHFIICQLPYYTTVSGIIVCCSLFAAQHFQSSDMSLSERFAMYQRKAAEVEMMKPRKSPEIHRYTQRLTIWPEVMYPSFSSINDLQCFQECIHNNHKSNCLPLESYIICYESWSS